MDEHQIEDGLVRCATRYVKEMRERMGVKDCVAIPEARK
jgi:hypothetical protein